MRRSVFGVLGPVVAWDGDGQEIALRGPRHRAVLAAWFGAIAAAATAAYWWH